MQEKLVTGYEDSRLPLELPARQRCLFTRKGVELILSKEAQGVLQGVEEMIL